MFEKVAIIGLTILLTACGTTSNIRVNSTYDSGYSVQGTLTESQRSELAMFTLSLLDTKYNWGGKKPYFGLDCSGLVSYVFKNSLNIILLGAAKDIVKHGVNVPLEHARLGKLEIGDLLFFNTTGKSYSHVGIYIGNNSFIHASSGKGKVIVSSVFNKYYFNRLETIKRV